MYPPAQDHFVCHFKFEPLRLSTPVHCEPDVASAWPQRFLRLLVWWHISYANGSLTLYTV
jgi:hypothetical protein